MGLGGCRWVRDVIGRGRCAGCPSSLRRGGFFREALPCACSAAHGARGIPDIDARAALVAHRA